MDLNTVSLVGKLTKAPSIEERDNYVVADLELAVSEQVKRDGEWQHIAHPFEVRVWGKQAKACDELLREGSQVGIAGRLSRDDRGAQVVATSVQFLSPVEAVAA